MNKKLKKILATTMLVLPLTLAPTGCGKEDEVITYTATQAGEVLTEALLKTQAKNEYKVTSTQRTYEDGVVRSDLTTSVTTTEMKVNNKQTIERVVTENGVTASSWLIYLNDNYYYLLKDVDVSIPGGPSLNIISAGKPTSYMVSNIPQLLNSYDLEGKSENGVTTITGKLKDESLLGDDEQYFTVEYQIENGLLTKANLVYTTQYDNGGDHLITGEIKIDFVIIYTNIEFVNPIPTSTDGYSASIHQ